MQTIYIDTMICINLYIDYLILCTVKHILHINIKPYRILIGSLIGALSTLVSVLNVKSIFISSLYMISTSVLITYISFGKSSFRNFFIRMLTFLGINMILSAGVLSINLIYKPTGVFIFNNTLYFDVSPEILIFATAGTYLILSLYHRISSQHKIKSYIHKVTLFTDKSNKFTFESAVDTGCNLKEPFSGLPVILTEEEILRGIEIPRENLRIIPYSTASCEDTAIYGFKPKYIDIDGKVIHNGCYVALLNNKLKGEVKSIMGPELTEVL